MGRRWQRWGRSAHHPVGGASVAGAAGSGPQFGERSEGTHRPEDVDELEVDRSIVRRAARRRWTVGNLVIIDGGSQPHRELAGVPIAIGWPLFGRAGHHLEDPIRCRTLRRCSRARHAARRSSEPGRRSTPPPSARGCRHRLRGSDRRCAPVPARGSSACCRLGVASPCRRPPTAATSRSPTGRWAGSIPVSTTPAR